jgi:hypothetical protein
MSTKEWLGGKKGWDFIRENNNIMSPAEMADYFGITTEELTREKFEMGITVDEDGSNSEYELHRCLNRFERAYSRGADATIALREHTHTMLRKKL